MKNRLILLALLPAIILAPLISLVRYVWCALFAPSKAWGIARAFDRVFNVAANGSEKETLSSRAARARNEGRPWGCVLCRFLDEIDPGHCTFALDV